jgi:hypothetical protein
VSRLVIPRGAVVALAVLIVGGPATLVLANQYRRDGQERVMHHHTPSYTIYNGVSGDNALTTQVDNARVDWNQSLAPKETINVPATTSQGGSEIEFKRQTGLGDNGATVAWTSVFHTAHTVASFNAFYFNGMGQAEKQGRACNVIGNIIGLTDASSGSPRNDCLENPIEYRTVGQESLDLVRDWYGPSMSHADITGSLIDNKDELELNRHYSVTATGTGHAMAKVQILENGVPLAGADPGSSPCEEKCSRSVSLTTKSPQELGLGLGPHTLQFRALNSFGVNGGTSPGEVKTVTKSITVVPDDPDSACPSNDTDAAAVADLLTGPGAEDDGSEPSDPEQPVPLSAGSSTPNASLEPIVRAPDNSAGPPAANHSGTSSVNLGVIRWCVIQPTRDAFYEWSRPDEVLSSYLNHDPPIPIRSMKVVDAPDWAVGAGCEALAQKPNPEVKKCPPLPVRDSELRAFAAAVADRYGPNSAFGIPRISFWNEPNLWENWGAEDRLDGNGQRGRAEHYSDRLAVFEAGATSPTGDAGINVDAGEVAAGGTVARGNGVREWATYFADYNHETYPDQVNPSRDRNYDVFAIHPYSEAPWQIAAKVRQYRALPGVGPVSVTEFGWAVTNDSITGGYKCVPSEATQATKFSDTVAAVRASDVPVQSLGVFNLVDAKKVGPPCPDGAWYNEVEASGPYAGQPADDYNNSYGLYRRNRNGTLTGFVPPERARLLRDAFAGAQLP